MRKIRTLSAWRVNIKSRWRRMITAKNMTMAKFAEDLRRIAEGYVRVPVEDRTGLD